MKLKDLSLRYKLLAALTVIPLIGLSLFLLLAVSIFERDKIAYVFDSSLSVSKTRATRASSEISSVISIAQAVVLSYIADTKSLSETGTYYFEREAKLEAFQIHALDPETMLYERTVDLIKPSAEKIFERFKNDSAGIQELIDGTREKGITVTGIESAQGKMLMVARFGDFTDPKHVVAVMLFDAAELARLFSDSGPYRGFLANKQSSKLIFPMPDLEPGWGAEAIWGELAKRKTPEGISEILSPAQSQYLASFSEVGVADLVVVSMVDRSAALSAVAFLIRKSTLFFIAIISVLTIIAVLASRGLTSALRGLSQATMKVADGDFGVRVDVKSGGEIGVLATSFNAMAGEVERLLKETAEKARMESELATAKTVQETLFPDSRANFGNLEIAGHYQPASECGGDWWYYCESHDKVYIWIGDATGHGAPAALLTSAARAVASVINFGPPRPVGEALGILNRAICETSKGKMMMTFFLACIDKKTGEMTYANASHEPPLLLHEMDDEPKRDDFEPLISVNNPRLGERLDHEFKQASVMLKAGDRIVFYTDGVVDVKSPDEKTWGERRFLKALSSELTQSPATGPALDGVIRILHDFRSETPLDDDVTLILCKYDGEGAESAPEKSPEAA
jgi:phosphoserine phosphatase RsbU/P